MPQHIDFTRPNGSHGELLLWSDVDLEQMAQVSDSDAQDARSYWQRYLPHRLRGILDAQSTVTRDGLHLL